MPYQTNIKLMFYKVKLEFFEHFAENEDQFEKTQKEKYLKELFQVLENLENDNIINIDHINYTMEQMN